MKESFRNVEKKLVETGKNSAGYSMYEMVQNEPANDPEYQAAMLAQEQVESEQKILEAKEEKGWLNDKQRRQLQVLLASFGIATMPIKASDQQEVSESVPRATYVAMEDSGHVQSVKDDLDNETPEDMIDRAMKGNFTDQGESIEELKDEFTKRVEEYINSQNEWNVRTTLERSKETPEELGGLTKAEYVKQNIEFGDAMPKDIQDALREVIDGVPAAETNYDETLVSEEGAFGGLQTMPSTYKEFGGEEGRETSWVSQVDVAGKIYTKKYEDLVAGLEEELLDTIERQYSSRDSYIKNFLVPLIFGAFHAGESRWKEAVEGYMESLADGESVNGKELVPAISDYGFENKRGKLNKFRSKSREYPFKVIAWSHLLNKQTQEQPTKIALADNDSVDGKG